VQDEQHLVMTQRLPVQLPGFRPAGVAGGEGQAGGGERLDHAAGRSGRLELREQPADRGAHRRIGVEHDVAGGVITQPGREPHRELAAGGLGQQPAAHPGLQVMQLEFLCRPARYAAVVLGRLRLASSCVLGALANSA
jgi:hypothetical protein